MQQVNLYQDQFQSKRTPLNAHMIFVMIGLTLIILTSIQGYTQWQHKQIQAEQQHIAKQQQEMVARLGQLALQTPKIKRDASLEQQVLMLQRDIDSKQRLLQGLSLRREERISGFSQHLDGLARQYRTGLWLTGIHIDSGGKQIGLQGTTYKAPMVAQFIQRLGNEPAFDGKHFDVLALSRHEKQQRQIEFQLRTSQEPKP